MKIALVTGSSRGIGRSAALQLAKRGVAVVVTFLRQKEQALAVVKQIEDAGGTAVALQLDISDVSSSNFFS